MKTTLLVPNGFCYGVITAYNKTLETIKNNLNKKIYMLGWLVHNKKVVDEFIQHGVQILDDSKKSRLEIIEEFDDVANSILILSAHGTELKVIELAKKKGFEIVDLTCKYVYKTHDVIKEKFEAGYNVFFIGKKKHPETIAILNRFKNVKLIENINDLQSVDFYDDQKYFCTNQTTISQYQFDDITNELKNKCKDIEFQNDICDATKIRQDAVINMDPSIDICIVIGDKKSSNTDELYKIASQKVESYKINDLKDIDQKWFDNKNHCGITAGASTPRFLIDKIYSYIKGIKNEY